MLNEWEIGQNNEGTKGSKLKFVTEFLMKIKTLIFGLEKK